MSDKGTVSPKEKEATEKRGRGRPRKQPQVKTSDVSSANFFLFLTFDDKKSVPVRFACHEMYHQPKTRPRIDLRVEKESARWLIKHTSKLTSVPADAQGRYYCRQRCSCISMS